MTINIDIISQRLLSLLEYSYLQVVNLTDCLIGQFQYRGSGRRIRRISC